MIESIINLRSKMGDTLDTREAAMALFEDVRILCSDNKKVTFDFDGVSFVSRSFADQFYKERTKLFEKYKCVSEIKDAEQHVFDMLQIVAKTQHSKNRDFIYYPVYVLESEQKLSDFLLSI